ncbi:helix-turn-helix transcriptional regulator [Paenibacillus daejeonensis]|uniref:helix-turn-helix transcriptional regulator n=1 Tax=Paenibacillus daejeonensis TaxID=135193 RepID=UPI000376B51A|nr:AraC family transcriptional regulator [Paenibacillus daejeonensis]
MQQDEIEKVMRYIEEHLTRPFSLQEVAQHCNYSPYHFSVFFHRTFGETMRSYLRKRRLTRAAEQLRDTELSILSIGLTFGYGSQEAFSRAFVERFGLTPRQYRETQAPIQETYPQPLLLPSQGNDGIQKKIQHLQEQIGAPAEVNILHVLNGSCMLERFKTSELMQDDATYVSFNEAMCWGETDPQVFSPSFNQRRVHALQTTEAEYRSIVIESLRPLFEERFDIIVLWFGDDMFCQLNLITMLAYLDQIGYEGDVFFCMALERIDDILADAYEIDPRGYAEIYKSVLCEHRKPDSAMMPVTYQAIRMYLSYRGPDSPIIRYIQRHRGKEHLVADLLKQFPDYGLGDRQYEWMINQLRTP